MVLVAVGLIGYFASDSRHWTALLPAILGALLVVLAFLAMRSETNNRHFMHAAMLVALLGIGGTLPRAMRIGDGGSAAVVSLITAIVLVAYLVFGIRSFRNARRAP